MPDKEPTFENADNRLLWQELKHIRTALDKMNGAVVANTSHRISSEERWRLHEKEHDKVGRDNVVVSTISGVTAALVAFFGSHAIK